MAIEGRRAADRTPATLGGPEASHLKRQLSNPAGNLTILVSDATTGEPLSGVGVAALKSGETEPLSEVASRDGVAELELPAGSYTVLIRHESYALSQLGGVLVSSGTQSWEVELSPGVLLSGRVRGPAGDGIDQAVVTFLGTPPLQVVTNSKGHFEVRLEPGIYEVAVRAGRYSRRQLAPIEVSPEGANRLEITLGEQ